MSLIAGLADENVLVPISRDFNGIDTSIVAPYDINNCVFNLFTAFRESTPYWLRYAPYFLLDDITRNYSVWYNNAVNIGFTMAYGSFEISQWDIDGIYFIDTLYTGEWTIANTKAVSTGDLFIITKDDSNNKINIKLNSAYDTLEKLNTVYKSRNTTKSYVAIFFKEKSGTTKYRIIQNLTNVTSDFSLNEVDENTEITINLTANTGYNFFGTPTYEMGGNSYTFTSTATGYTATITVTSNITVTAIAALRQCTITQNLTNVTSSYSGSSVSYGTTITVNLSVASGYIFSGVPSYTMGENTYNFIAAESGYTATITVTDDLIITAAAVEQVQYRLNLNLTQCTCNYEAGLYNGGTVLNIVLTATGDLYGFTTAPVMISGGNSYPFTISSDKKTATLQWTINAHCTVRGTAAEGTAVRTDFTYCNSIPATFPIYFAGETITCSLYPINSNYEFQDTPYIRLSYFEGQRTFEGTLQTDGSYTFSVTISSEYDLEDILIYGRAGLKKASSKYGLINLYSPTIQELENMAAVRFQNGVDLGQYIISLRRMYCTIPILGRDVIDLGYYFSSVETSVINTDFITVSCGTVSIDEEYENGFDYAPNTKAEIFLPLIGIQSLETNRIMGREITLNYHFNIVTNDVTAILKAGNEVLETWTGKGGYDLPFIYNAYTGGILANIDDIPLTFAGFTPFIRLTSNIPYYPTSTDTDSKDTMKYCRIGDNEGYSQFEEVDFNGTGQITSVEIQELKNLLNGGVVLPAISS